MARKMSQAEFDEAARVGTVDDVVVTNAKPSEAAAGDVQTSPAQEPVAPAQIPSDVLAANLAAVTAEAMGKAEPKPQSDTAVQLADEDNKDVQDDTIPA